MHNNRTAKREIVSKRVGKEWERKEGWMDGEAIEIICVK